MPKFRVIVGETVYRRGVVEALSKDAVYEMDSEDMDLEEFDSQEEVDDVEEIT